jgi:hypothetical protein
MRVRRRLRLRRRRAVTVHVERATSEVVPEPERDEASGEMRQPDPDLIRAELERLRRDALRTRAEGYGD